MAASVQWDDLPAAVRAAVEDRTGPVAGASPAGEGMSTAVRLVLRTPGGQVFIKGTGPRAPRIARERLALGAEVAPFVPSLSPPLLFRLSAGGWDVTGWAAVPGRPASLAPGSPDITAVTALLAGLGTIPAPDVPGMWSLAQYWGRDAGGPRVPDGGALVHTDPHGANFLVGGDRPWMLDWGWAARGPAWMTAARLVLFLVDAGWEAAAAERAVAAVPAWAAAPPGTVSAYAMSSVASWEAAIRRDPGNEGLRRWHGIARAWAAHRAALPAGTRGM